jgi:hypothetical protein
MKRVAHPPLSPTGFEALACYEHWFRKREDLMLVSIRNDMSDLRHFIAWYETERELHLIPSDPSFALKRVGQEESTPHHLDDQMPLLARCWRQSSPMSIPTMCHRFGYRMAESVPSHRLAHTMGHHSLDTTKLFVREQNMMHNKPPGPVPGRR